MSKKETSQLLISPSLLVQAAAAARTVRAARRRPPTRWHGAPASATRPPVLLLPRADSCSRFAEPHGDGAASAGGAVARCHRASAVAAAVAPFPLQACADGRGAEGFRPSPVSPLRHLQRRRHHSATTECLLLHSALIGGSLLLVALAPAHGRCHHSPVIPTPPPARHRIFFMF